MRLQLDARARRLLRRLPAVNVYSAAELLLMAGLAVQTARLIWTIVTPVGPLGEWRPADVVVPGDPAALLASYDPFFAAEAAPTAGVITAAPVKLFGVRLDEASGRGSAIVAGPDGVQKSVSVGEEVAPGVTLKALAFDHVTLSRGGAAEDLYLDQSGPAASVQPGAPPPGGALTSPSSNGVSIGELRSDIVGSPRLDGGRLTGLTLSSRGPAFARAGLQSGDVLTAINGRPVAGLGDLDQVGTGMAGGGALPVTVERNGQPVQLSIAITPR